MNLLGNKKRKLVTGGKLNSEERSLSKKIMMNMQRKSCTKENSGQGGSGFKKYALLLSKCLLESPTEKAQQMLPSLIPYAG